MDARSNSSERLKEIMSLRGLKQIDILEKCKPYCEKYSVKMGKSSLSQYISGKVEPSQDKLFILGQALGVQEAWLMGFDVPMNPKDTSADANEDFDLLLKFSLLQDRDKKIIMDMINSMLKD